MSFCNQKSTFNIASEAASTGLLILLLRTLENIIRLAVKPLSFAASIFSLNPFSGSNLSEISLNFLASSLPSKLAIFFHLSSLSFFCSLLYSIIALASLSLSASAENLFNPILSSSPLKSVVVANIYDFPFSLALFTFLFIFSLYDSFSLFLLSDILLS